jgi:glycosyltransferase involved in cell wall biosynthesis
MYFILATVCLVITSIYWIVMLWALYRYNLKQATGSPKVSVIVAYKNEQAHIGTTIRLIADQTYADFEIIAINDHSTDHGARDLASVDDSRLTLLDAKGHGKKAALTQAIHQSNGEWLLFTDADCRPATKRWIETMMSQSDGVDAVLGYGPHDTDDRSLGYLQRYETATTAMQYFTYAILGHAYMGVGRNLLVKKSAWEQYRYDNHLDLVSGDDDLLIQELSAHHAIGVCLSPQSFVYSDAKKTWSAFIHQKRRHMSTAPHYQIKHQLLLGLYSGANILFWITFILGILLVKIPWFLCLTLLVARWILWSLCTWLWFWVLRCRPLWRWSLILDLCLSFYHLLLLGLGLRKTKSWS